MRADGKSQNPQGLDRRKILKHGLRNYRRGCRCTVCVSAYERGLELRRHRRQLPDVQEREREQRRRAYDPEAARQRRSTPEARRRRAERRSQRYREDAAHRADLLTIAKKFRESYPEKTRRSSQAWRSKNPEAVSAQRKRNLKRRSALNAELRERASRHGYVWTGPELEIASRADLRDVQVAEMLGRSLNAVRSMRQKLKDEHPREMLLAGV